MRQERGEFDGFARHFITVEVAAALTLGALFMTGLVMDKIVIPNAPIPQVSTPTEIPTVTPIPVTTPESPQIRALLTR